MPLRNIVQTTFTGPINHLTHPLILRLACSFPLLLLLLLMRRLLTAAIYCVCKSLLSSERRLLWSVLELFIQENKVFLLKWYSLISSSRYKTVHTNLDLLPARRIEKDITAPLIRARLLRRFRTRLLCQPQPKLFVVAPIMTVQFRRRCFLKEIPRLGVENVKERLV